MIRDIAALESMSERDLYAKIYANSQDSVFLVDPGNGGILFSNPKASEDTNYEESELEGMTIFDLFLPEDRRAIEALLQSTLQWNSGIDPQRILRRKSAKKIVTEISSLLVEFDGKKVVSCAIRDITQRVKAEAKIRQYSKELEKVNSELEDRVKSRTQELADVNDRLSSINDVISRQKKALDDVMNNIQQAIVTINPDLKINPDYSQYSGDVFGNREIVQADLIDFFYRPEDRADRGKHLKDWLSTVFNEPDTWEMVKDFGPRELQYFRFEKGSEDQVRDLKLEWRPIYEKDVITKMMLVCLDVTEQKRLESEIKKKEAEHREELELIGQLIHLPLDVVNQFVADFQRNLDEARKSLSICLESRGRETHEFTMPLKQLIRNLHTIKGSSKQFRLNVVHDQTHELETCVERALSLADSVSPQNSEELFKFWDAVNVVENRFSSLDQSLGVIITLYEKIIGGQSVGGGVRNAKTVMVPLQKIDALAGKLFSGSGNVSNAAVRKALAWLMQMPVRQLFDRLEDLARSVAIDLGVDLKIKREGDDLRIDYRVMNILYDSLLHAIRNSLDHGADTPEERKALNKGPEFTVTLRASKFGDRFIKIEVEDDGRGIDTEVIKKKVVDKGLIDSHRAVRATRDQVLNFVFLSGFSTRDEVDEYSGRGIGLDVVKEVAEVRLGGDVAIQSEIGKGTCLTVMLPMEVSISDSINYLCVIDQSEKKTALEMALNVKIRQINGPHEFVKDMPRFADSLLIIEPETLAKMSKQSIPFNSLQLAKTACLHHDLTGKQMVSELMEPYGARHVLYSSSKGLTRQMKVVGRKMSSFPFEWGLEPYLRAGVDVQSCQLREYKKKNEVIAALITFAKKLRAFSGLPDILATIADEMIMNGMFDAPRDKAGKPKYNHLNRTPNLVLQASEEVRFRFGADQEYVAISVEDNFGALTPSVIVSNLHRCYQKGAAQIQQIPGGAGLGLYMIFDNSHYLIVNSAPGRRTEMISLVHLSRSYEEYQQEKKSFSFFVNTGKSLK